MNECPLCNVECAEPAGIQDEAVGLVLKERLAQDKKWGPDRTLRNSQWIKITLEELGEASASDLDHEPMARTLLEVIQVSASALAWAEDMLRRRERMREDASLERTTFCTDHERSNCFCGFGYRLDMKEEIKKTPTEKLIYQAREHMICGNPPCDRLTETEILYCCHACKVSRSIDLDTMRDFSGEFVHTGEPGSPICHSELCDKNQKEWREKRCDDSE